MHKDTLVPAGNVWEGAAFEDLLSQDLEEHWGTDGSTLSPQNPKP